MGERRHIQVSGAAAIDETISNPEPYELRELRLALGAEKDLAGLQLVRPAPAGFSEDLVLWSPEVDPATGAAVADALWVPFNLPISVKAENPLKLVWANGDSVAWEAEFVIDTL